MVDFSTAPDLMQGQGLMGAPQAQVPPQLPTVVKLEPALPSPPDDQLIEAAKVYVPEWLKRGIDDNKAKANDRMRLENLFLNRLPLDWWNKSQSELAAHIDAAMRGELEDEETETRSWRSQLCMSIANLVLTYADTAFAAIFSTEEWLTVRPESGTTQSSVEDKQYSTSDKLKVELMRSLEESKVRSAIYQLLMFSAIYRRCFSKNVWDEQTVPVNYNQVTYLADPEQPDQPAIDPSTGQPIKLDSQQITRLEVVRSVPKIQALKPDCVIPDTFAIDADVQSWSGIGHVFETDWYGVMQGFADGKYNLSEAEFIEKWPEPSSVSGNKPVSELASDADREGLTEGDKVLGKLRGYEFQGLVPTEDGKQTECVCTWIVENDCEYPEEGFMVRLQPGTILRCGRRNIHCAQYTEWPDGGIGAAEPNLDLVFVISHLVNLIIDNLRLTINGEWEETASIEAHNPGKVHGPGVRWKVPEPGALKPLQQPAIDYAAAFNGVQYLSQEHQIRSGIDIARASTREKTAREVGFLEQQMTKPVGNRLQMFRENLLDPALTVALAQIQQFSVGNRKIPLKNADGIEEYAELTEDEIRTGRYRVRATLGNADSTRLAVAQTLERVTQTLTNVIPILAQQGDLVRLWPTVRAMLDKLDVPNLDQMHSKAAPPPPPGMEPQGMGQPGMPGPQMPPGPEGPPDMGGEPRPMERGELAQPQSTEEILAMLYQMAGADAEGRTGQI